MDEFQTIARLAEIQAGPFQRLGDAILPHIDPGLDGLIPNGINADDQTTKAFPDSYIGASPTSCVIAVEYSRKAEEIPAKFLEDYKKVRRRCRFAHTIYLVSAHRIQCLDLSGVTSLARQEGVVLHTIGAEAIAKILDEQRQDLRRHFLKIPIAAHSRQSLLAEMSHRCAEILKDQLTNQKSAIALPREQHARLIQLQRDAPPSHILIVGPLGIGKSTWMFAFANSLRSIAPTVFLRAADVVASDTLDPISDLITHSAYGANGGELTISLGELLGRERLMVSVIIDGIDEVSSYEKLHRGLLAFKRSRLAPRTHIVLTCREEAEGHWRTYFERGFQELLRDKDPRYIRMPRLRWDEPGNLLMRLGATHEEKDRILAFVPTNLIDRPLFLISALDLLRGDQLQRAPDRPGRSEIQTGDFVRGVLNNVLTKIRDGLRTDGHGPKLKAIVDHLGELAWACTSSLTASIRTDDLEGVLWQEDGESSLMGRCIQVGVLSESEGGLLRFHHAFYQHAILALVMKSATPNSWRQNLSRLSREALKLRTPAIAEYVTDCSALLSAIWEMGEPLLAVEVAGRARLVPDAWRERLFGPLRSLLSSRFPSDARLALRLLREIASPISEFQEFARTWYMGLGEMDPLRWHRVTCELFLKLEMKQAARIVLRHDALVFFPWSFPSLDFIRQLETCSQDFQTYLTNEAFRLLTSGSNTSMSCGIFLAIYRDQRLIDFCSAHLERKGSLDAWHCEALIRINTYESILVFSEFVDLKLADVRRLNSDPSLSRASRESSTGEIWDQLRDWIGYTRDYQHEQLLELVLLALESANLEQQQFGMMWASHLGERHLLNAWVLVYNRFRAMNYWVNEFAVENFIKKSPLSEVISVFEGTPYSELRYWILAWLHYHPTAECEKFLLGQVLDPDLGAAAAHSLGLMRSVAAVPSLVQRLAQKPDPAAIRALGQIGHELGVPHLVQMLPGLKGAGVGASLAWEASQALGEIGTETSLGSLVPYLGDASLRDNLLGIIVRAGNSHAEKILELCLERGIADATVGAAIFNNASSISGVFRSQVLWASAVPVIEAELEKVGEERFRGRIFACAGIFDLKSATKFLEDLAEGKQGERHREQAQFGLARRGHKLYSAKQLEKEVEELLERDMVHPQVAEEQLERWPRPMVRDFLLKKWHEVKVMGILRLLARFATVDDEPLFRQLEAESEIEIADLAHAWLRERN